MNKKTLCGRKIVSNDSACFAKGLCFILFLYSVNAVFLTVLCCFAGNFASAEAKNILCYVE